MSREAGAAGTPEPHPSGSRRSRSRLREWLRRRVVLPLLEPELKAAGEEVASLRAFLESLASEHEASAVRHAELGGRLDGVYGRVEELDRRLAAEAGAALREHLETRVDQALAEVADLRAAYLVTRSEFESVRDARLAAVDNAVEALQESAGRLQVEIERLRDATLPKVVEDAGAIHAAIERVQGELSELRDSRLARAEGDLAAHQGAIVALQGDLQSLADARVTKGEENVAGLQRAVEKVQEELRATRDERLARDERDLASLQRAISEVQQVVEGVSSGRLTSAEAGLGALQAGFTALQEVVEEVRDARLPALAGRTDALLEQIHLELTAVGGLVDRLIAREPIHVAIDPASEAALPAAIAAASASFVEALRGSRDEIAARAAEYVPLLRDHEPVLDLGCGRGELLEALQLAGIDARGVDIDPAMVSGCRRRGLAAEVGDAAAVLAGTPASTLGAVTAIHLLEHLSAAAWMSLLDEAARVLRSGGVLLVECPNPESLRVGGGLFWADATHRSPVHPQALSLAVRAVGLEMVETRFTHPFPPEQNLTRAGQSGDVRELAERLDAWLSAPRDFLLVARKAAPAG